MATGGPMSIITAVVICAGTVLAAGLLGMAVSRKLPGSLSRYVVFCFVAAAAAALIAGWAVFGGVPWQIDTGFATDAVVKLDYDNRRSTVKVTDSRDMAALRSLLSGWAYNNDVLDYPACMFDDSVSVTLYGHGRSITFCPAFDGDPLVEIDGTGKYLHMSDRRRKDMDTILRKYGLSFPI